MSTNAPTSPRPPDPGAHQATAEGTPRKIDLSMSQTLGGALAAMTAAALGSRLGVGGTIIGAAVASIIAGVAGAFYTASLRTGRDKVKTVWTGRIAGTDTKAAVDVVPETPVWDSPEAAAETRVLPSIPPMQSQTRPSEVSRPAAPRNLPWKGMLVGAFAIFAIAFVGLTGFELLSGSALSGGQGTTIQQVREPKPAAEPSSDESSESPSPSESESQSETPSPTPTPTPSELPVETPAAPQPPSEEPTLDQEPTPTPTPSETAETETPSSAPAPSAGGPGAETPAG